MRLIHVHTYELREFVGNLSTFPNYAILSHTWGDEEVSFQDFQTSLPSARQMKGFKKIKYCCDQAAKDGLDWAWVDTCCIDKNSSSELSEAINSMYNWYRTAIVCYAYLNDVLSMGDFDWELLGESIRWFQRGWTLQELIAPLTVKLFAEDWTLIGTKRNNAKSISEITGIDREVLRHERSPFQIPVAERMYWASKRRTTRAEDLAYCLMGLFDVNMPLLYGEGMKAFDRLQEQILKTTNDDTLFLWQMRSPEGFAWGDVGDGLTLKSSRMLACSPKDFDRRAGHFSLQPEHFFSEPQLMPRELGLRITLPMRKMDSSDISRIGLPVSFEQVSGRIFFAALGCLRREGESDDSRVVMLLEAATDMHSPEKKVLRRVQQLHCFLPLLETLTWPRHTCFVAGDAPNSFEKNEKLFLNHVDLKADGTFTLENVKDSR